MRSFACLVITISIVSITSCQPKSTTTPPLKTETEEDESATLVPPRLFDIAWDDRSPFSPGLIDSEQGALNQLAGASIYHIDLQIADDLIHLNGQEEVRYTNQETEPLEEVYFRLFPNLFNGAMVIQSVEVNHQDVNPSYELFRSAMRVPLSPALEPGDNVVISIAFSARVPMEGDGSYGIFIFEDDILTLAHFYPMIAVYDDEGWNLEIPPGFGDVTYVDSSFYIIQITAPSAVTIIASGIESDRQMIDNQQQITYAGGPMRDFYLAASSRYAVVSEKIGETTVNSYAPAEFSEGAETVLGYAVDALQIYSDRFGVYPFTEFDVVSTPTQALGIEYPGIVVIALIMYDLENCIYPPSYLESTVAHEVGHQWFYSVIGNDQLDEPWLDEAVVQYATLLYWQDLYGSSGAASFRQSLEDRWARVDKADIPIGMPVRSYSGVEYGAIVYGRGPLFVEALENTMGQETFNNFLHDYYETHKWGIATTDSFKQLAESECQCDLTELFSEWVYEK